MRLYRGRAVRMAQPPSQYLSFGMRGEWCGGNPVAGVEVMPVKMPAKGEILTTLHPVLTTLTTILTTYYLFIIIILYIK